MIYRFMLGPLYSITYPPLAAKALRKLERQHQRSLITAIEGLAQELHPDGVKKLRGEDRDGLRVGVVCRDGSGNINGGNSAYPNLAPFDRTIRIDADVTVSEQPASCEAHLNY